MCGPAKTKKKKNKNLYGVFDNKAGEYPAKDLDAFKMAPRQ